MNPVAWVGENNSQSFKAWLDWTRFSVCGGAFWANAFLLSDSGTSILPVMATSNKREPQPLLWVDFSFPRLQAIFHIFLILSIPLPNHLH